MLVREGYVAAYDLSLKIPVWVQYRLTRERPENDTHPRSNAFDEDAALRPQARATLEDYAAVSTDYGLSRYSAAANGRQAQAPSEGDTIVLRKRPVYYTVWAMKDGTVLVALPDRKPSKASLYKRERIDQDGIHRWYVQNNRAYMAMRDWKTKPFETIANCLNFRRVLRAQVEPKLDELQEQVAALKEQLDRIEEKLSA